MKLFLNHKLTSKNPFASVSITTFSSLMDIFEEFFKLIDIFDFVDLFSCFTLSSFKKSSICRWLCFPLFWLSEFNRSLDDDDDDDFAGWEDLALGLECLSSRVYKFVKVKIMNILIVSK